MAALSHHRSAATPKITVRIGRKDTDFNAQWQPVDFLLDTGSSVSLINETLASVIVRSCITLKTVTGEPIQVIGKTVLRVELLRRAYLQEFIVTRHTPNILGIDFLSKTPFILDLGKGILSDRETQITKSLRQPQHICSVVEDRGNIPPEIEELLITPATPIYPDVSHKIETNAGPVFHRARNLPPDKLLAAKTVFEKMLEDGIIEPSNSDWSSPLHLVPKSDGEWRPCGDFRALNNVTKPDRYSVPNLLTFSQQLTQKATIFSTLDLYQAYLQIPVDPEDIPKTAVITPFGLFQFKKMPFGLRNSSATFQRYIDSVLRGCPFAFAYVDDVLIASSTREEHIQHVREVVRRLIAAGLKLSFKKCVWFAESVHFLGFTVDAQGVAPRQDKVEAIISQSPPGDYVALRRVMGMYSFYRRHVPNFAEIVTPLRRLLNETQPKRGTRVPTVPFQWTAEHEASWNQLKNALSNAVILSHPTPSDQLTITTDASANAIGAALHAANLDRSPLAFYSRALSDAERKM